MVRNIVHYCLAAPSIRRLASLPMRGFTGTHNLVDEIQKGIVAYMEAGLFSENFADNVSKEYKGNLTKFVTNATHDCEDMILKCRWASENIPCASVFQPIMTQHGSCCVFNMMPRFILRKVNKSSSQVVEEKSYLDKEAIEAWGNFTDDMLFRDSDASDPLPKYPFYQKAGGSTNGLSILINPEMALYSTCNANDGWGLKMAAHSPISFPRVIDYGKAISHGSEIFVNIEPDVTTADKSIIKGLPIEERGCYFNDDPQSKLKSYKFYTAINCRDECIAKYTFAKCGCVRYFMPKKPEQKLCGAKKLKCSENAISEMATIGFGQFCQHCRPSCISLKYKMRLAQFPIRSGSPIFYNGSSGDGHKTATNYSILHVFIGKDTFNALERKQLYSLWDVLGKAGGILSITLGFSTICIVELFYFFTIRAWHHFHSKMVEDEYDDHGNNVNENHYYSSVRPRLSAIIKPKRFTRKRSANKIIPSQYSSFQDYNDEIPPFHLLTSMTGEKRH